MHNHSNGNELRILMQIKLISLTIVEHQDSLRNRDKQQLGNGPLVWPIKKDGNNPVNQSKLEVITRSRHKARENVHARATSGFGFTSDWFKKWRENFEPITE